MHVGVVVEVLPPGVEDGEGADAGAEVLGVSGDLLGGLGGGAQEQVVDESLVVEGDAVELVGEGVDEVK